LTVRSTVCASSRFFSITTLVVVLTTGGSTIVGEETRFEDPPPTQPTHRDAIEAFEVGAVEARTGALLLSGQAGGDVDGAMTWTLSHRSVDGLATVPFVVEVDGPALVAAHVGADIVIGLYAYVVDDNGVVVDHIAQGLVLQSDVYRDDIVASGLRFTGQTTLPPGNFALRVMVRNQRTGAFFMSWDLVTLPSVEDQSLLLLPPLVPESGGEWTPVRQSGVESLVTLGDNARISPAARPVLLANRPWEVWLGGGGWEKNANIGVRIVNKLGRTVSEPIVSREGPVVGDFAFQRITLSPVDVPAGTYTMVVTVSDDEANQVIRRGIGFVVADDDELTTWVAARRTESFARPASVIHEDPVPKLSKRKMRAGYRRALVVLGGGDALAARQQVAALERQVLADPSQRAISDLGESEYAVSKDIAKSCPQCLMPMALLHRDLYQGYVARQEGALAVHSRKMTISYALQLARLMPENGFSEALMVNLAADLAQVGAQSAARDLLRQTVRLNPAFGPALLSLGFSFEQSGQYEEAASTYRRLVDAHPGSAEGLLRLGINQIRIGRGDHGTELLHRLLTGEAPPWIKAIAGQELVRYHIRVNLVDEAERSARLAIEFTPNDQRLRILLGGILEQLGRHDEALATLTDLPTASRGVSPRARYTEWPSLGVRASQAQLSARARDAMPALQPALTGGGGGG
jgi:tetratricopeptide (TPR) repeat protein